MVLVAGTAVPHDLESPANAIAAKFAGIAGMRGASPRHLDQLPGLPWVTVLNPTMELIERAIGSEMWEYAWPCLLIVEADADQGRAQAELRSYVPLVFSAWEVGVKLGLDFVQDSWVRAATPDFLAVGDGNLPIYRFEIVTHMRINVTRTS